MKQRDVKALEEMNWLIQIIYASYSWQELALSGHHARAADKYHQLTGISVKEAYDTVCRYAEEMELLVLAESQKRNDGGVTP